jgi:hypothetical protein
MLSNTSDTGPVAARQRRRVDYFGRHGLSHSVREFVGTMAVGTHLQPFLYVADAIKNPAPPESNPARPIAARSPALSGSGRDQISLVEALLCYVFVGPLVIGARHAVLLIAVKRHRQSKRVTISNRGRKKSL